MTAPTNGSGGANPCLHEAWETHHGGGARCIDCRQYLPTPPAQVGAATDSGEGVEQVDALDLARMFHEAYERLAPMFGYETREDTKIFDPSTSNGRLMIATASEVLAAMPSTDQEGLVGTTSADTILYSIKHHFAVMGDTREGIECALADARSLVANLEARARQTGSEGA